MIYIVCLFLLIFISYQEQQIDIGKQYGYLIQKSLTVLCALIIGLINEGIIFISKKLVSSERHSSHTEQNIQLAIKLSWAMFINTALVPYLLFIYTYAKEESIKSISLFYENLFYIFLGSIIVSPIFKSLNLFYYYKLCRRMKIIRQGDRCLKTQYQVNQIFEDPIFDVGYRYALVNKTIMITIFFSSFFPVSLFFGLIALMIIYLSYKYDFIKRSQLPNTLSAKFHEQIISTIMICPVIYFIGFMVNIGFLYDLSCQNVQFYATIYTSLGLIVLTFIINQFKIDMKLYGWLKKSNEAQPCSSPEYKEAQAQFSMDYELSNPITAIEAIKSYEENSIGDQKNQMTITQKLKRSYVDEITEQFSSSAQQQKILNCIEYYAFRNSSNLDIINGSSFNSFQKNNQNQLYMHTISNFKIDKHREILKYGVNELDKFLLQANDKPQRSKSEMRVSQDSEVTDSQHSPAIQLIKEPKLLQPPAKQVVEQESLPPKSKSKKIVRIRNQKMIKEVKVEVSFND